MPIQTYRYIQENEFKQKIAEIPVVAQNDVAQKGWW